MYVGFEHWEPTPLHSRFFYCRVNFFMMYLFILCNLDIVKDTTETIKKKKLCEKSDTFYFQEDTE